MRQKLLSNLLIETREALDLSPEEMAFILDLKEQMYRIYESGRFDKTKGYSIKDSIAHKIDTLDLEIKKKMVLLEIALRKFEKNYGINYGKKSPQNGHNLKEKPQKIKI